MLLLRSRGRWLRWVFQIEGLAWLSARRRARYLLLLKRRRRCLNYFGHFESVLHGSTEKVIVWIIAVLGRHQGPRSSIYQHLTSLPSHFGPACSTCNLMIYGFGADKELIETAQYVIFRRISAEPGLKSAHSECIIAPRSSCIIAPALLLAAPIVMTVARVWLVTSLSRNIVAWLERIREIWLSPDRLVLFLGYGGLGHIFLWRITGIGISRLWLRVCLWVILGALVCSWREKTLVETDIVFGYDRNALVLNNWVLFLFLDLSLAPCGGYWLIVDEVVVAGSGRFCRIKGQAPLIICWIKLNNILSDHHHFLRRTRS